MTEQWQGFPIFGEGSLECWGGGEDGVVPSGLLVLLSPAEALPLNHNIRTKCIFTHTKPVTGYTLPRTVKAAFNLRVLFNFNILMGVDDNNRLFTQ